MGRHEPKIKDLLDNLENVLTTNDDGDPIIRTSAVGEFSVTGATTAIRGTEMIIDDQAWYAVPATPLTGRNNAALQNQSASNVRIHTDNTAPGTKGWILAPNDVFVQDIKNNLIFYVRAEAGASNVKVFVWEVG